MMFVLGGKLARVLERTQKEQEEVDKKVHLQWWWPFRFLWENCGFLLVMCLVIQNSYSLFRSYGPTAALSPLGVGRILFYSYLFDKVHRMKLSDFVVRDYCQIWS